MSGNNQDYDNQNEDSQNYDDDNQNNEEDYDSQDDNSQNNGDHGDEEDCEDDENNDDNDGEDNNENCGDEDNEDDDDEGGENNSNGPKYIRLRGLPWSATHKEILDFLGNVNVIGGASGIHLITSRWDGKNTGEAYVEVKGQQDVIAAMKLDNATMGHRYIEVFNAAPKEAKEAMRKTSSHGTSYVVKLRGLPYSVTEQQVEEFFNGLEIKPDREGIIFVMDRRGRATGEAFVQFESQEDTEQALGRNREKIGHRYIEIFRSSLAELKRSTSGNGRMAPYDLKDRGSNRGGGGNDYGNNNRNGRWGNNGGFGVGANNTLGFNNLPSFGNSGNFGNNNGGGGGNFGNFGNNGGNGGGGNFGNFGNNGGNGNFGNFGGNNGGGFGNNSMDNNSNGGGFNRFSGNSGNFGNDFGDFGNFGNNRGNNSGNMGGGGSGMSRGGMGSGNNNGGFNNFGNFGNNMGGGGGGGNGFGGNLGGGFGGSNMSGISGGVSGGNFGPIGGGRNDDYYVILMRGLPFSSFENDVFKFFEPLRPANVRIHYQKKSGRHNGTAEALFETYDDAQLAMKRHRCKMGQRYIELFFNGKANKSKMGNNNFSSGNSMGNSIGGGGMGSGSGNSGFSRRI